MSLAVAVVTLLTGACSSAAGPDVSHAGQIDYACALADQVEDGRLQTLEALSEQNSDLYREVAAVSSLVGGWVGRPDQELAEAGRHVYHGLIRTEGAEARAGLDRMREHCPGQSGSAEVDVTETGQKQYACALAGHVDGEHGEAESWAVDDRAWGEVLSVSVLVGVVSGHAVSGPAELTEPGTSIFRGVANLNHEMVQSGLDEIIQQCPEL